MKGANHLCQRICERVSALLAISVTQLARQCDRVDGADEPEP